MVLLWVPGNIHSCQGIDISVLCLMFTIKAKSQNKVVKLCQTLSPSLAALMYTIETFDRTQGQESSDSRKVNKT